ncbi:MAG: undecaprenyl-diphosphate phosphatase [Myxococcota bacterium]
MNNLDHPLTAAILGAVQGLTEFLPVSSSGHVALGALLLGIGDLPLEMVILVHAGTLIATLLVVGRDVLDLDRGALRGLTHPAAYARTNDGRIVLGVVLGSIPTGIMGLGFKDHVETFSHDPVVIGACFLASAALLIATRFRNGDADTLPLWAYTLVGLAQGFAILPGLSRSGTTIAVAMMLGLKPQEAFRFSFLLSLPAITGAVLLEFRDPEVLKALGSAGLIAGAVALVVGYFALLLLRRVVTSGRLWAFALYLIPLGVGLLLFY